MTAKTLRREPLNAGVAFSLLFHAAVVGYLVFLVHPHVSFLDLPKQNMPVVELQPPAPPAPPAKPRTPPPARPSAQPAQQPAETIQSTATAAPAVSVAPATTDAPTRQVGTVVPSSYYSELEALIQRSLVYPRVSVAQDQEGTCTVRVAFARDGSIESAQMARPTGYGPLDGECREVFQRIGRFPPIPADASPASTDFSIELPITFSLQ